MLKIKHDKEAYSDISFVKIMIEKLKKYSDDFKTNESSSEKMSQNVRTITQIFDKLDNDTLLEICNYFEFKVNDIDKAKTETDRRNIIYGSLLYNIFKESNLIKIN